MSDYAFVKIVVYNANSTFSFQSTISDTLTDADDDDTFESGDFGTSTDWEYQGTITQNGIVAPLFENTGISGQKAAYFATDPGNLSGIPHGPITSGSYMFCFGAGTLIATPEGERAVEALQIGDLVLTAQGRTVPVRWLGRQTTFPAFSARERLPVRIRAGALGDGVPHSDLVVTADHGMIIDGLVINASALVNGDTVDWVPLTEMDQTMIVYHVETEDHDVILANGAASETFIDVAGRRGFDNYQEYLDLYGHERIIPPLPQPRISSARHLPRTIQARLRSAASARLA